MIKNLEIKNFKSIKHLKLACKRINIFIGEPNTGKSNILEGLGMLSFGSYNNSLKSFVRFITLSNLFYDENLDEHVSISFDDKFFEISFENGRFKGIYNSPERKIEVFDYDYIARGSRTFISDLSQFKFYRFFILESFPKKNSEFLLPPDGKNLLTIFMTHKSLRSTVKQIFKSFGLELMFKPQEDKIEVVKAREEVLVSYPYSVISETLQRIIFYLVAIESNKNSVLVFEEPEAHAFPYYTKFLAERVVLEKNDNQYFISTHNPYFLFPILEKTPENEVNVFITYFENYQTKVKPLSKEDKEEIMKKGEDIFFNIEKFLERK